MPVTPTYPGVYIEEIPSGVHTILGVATSITAFVGATPRGPINEPVTTNSFGDYERTFGGLSPDTTLGFSIQDFFLNGGGQAIVVRVVSSTASAAVLQDSGHGLFLKAVAPGTWANQVRARIDNHVLQMSADQLGVSLADLFNLTLWDGATGSSETFPNVTFVDSTRRLDRILAASSSLFRATNLGSAVVSHAGATELVWIEDAQSSPVTTMGQEGGTLTDTDIIGSQADKTGLFGLEKADLFNLLVIPPYEPSGDVEQTVRDAGTVYCEQPGPSSSSTRPPPGTARPPPRRASRPSAPRARTRPSTSPASAASTRSTTTCWRLSPPRARWPGCTPGSTSRAAVWKAPAGLETGLIGVVELSVPLTDPENGELNPLGVNCLRVRPAVGPVVWGARTRMGDDRLTSEWKYVPVRRLALYLEESLYRGTQWVIFEPNDEPLWAQIRLNVGAFLQNLFRQGAFQGRMPSEAYFVKVDRETTTQNDIDSGIANVVGFAPLKPAEFVILKIQQIAGQIQT